MSHLIEENALKDYIKKKRHHMASFTTIELKCSRSANSLLAHEAAIFGPVIKKIIWPYLFNTSI